MTRDEANDAPLLISPIRDGTVIDHITGGEALNVLKIIGITGSTGETISVATNVTSGKVGLKDVVKIADRELLKEEVDKIALIAPHATINIIREYRVIEKKGVVIPKTLTGVIRCPNPGCISNTNEPIESRFAVFQKGVQCAYCDWIINRDITSHLI
jgi:aspartate carbamoyltransferase regulatory subunit